MGREPLRRELDALLRDMPAVETMGAATVEEGLALLGLGPWALVVCARELPDGSGAWLLERAAAEARGARRVLVLERELGVEMAPPFTGEGPDLVLCLPAVRGALAELALLLE